MNVVVVATIPRGWKGQTGEVESDDYVRYGTSGAIWRVGARVQVGDDVQLNLWRADPHDVPPAYPLTELPLPGAIEAGLQALRAAATDG